MAAETIEINGTVKAMNKKGTGFLLNEYTDWFNFGSRYEGPRPFLKDAAITLTYEESIRADGSSSFFVLSAWPTTGQAGPVPPQVTTPGPKPIANPQTPGYVETIIEGSRPAPTGPTPTPPNREQSILFQVCLKAAQEWVLAVDSVANTPAEVLNVADLYYVQGSRLINGESLNMGDGDPGPEEPA